MRSSTLVAPDRVRYALRATPVGIDGADGGMELAREIDTAVVRDKIANGQAIPTPESTFEDLWQQLRLDLDTRYD